MNGVTGSVCALSKSVVLGSGKIGVIFTRTGLDGKSCKWESAIDIDLSPDSPFMKLYRSIKIKAHDFNALTNDGRAEFIVHEINNHPQNVRIAFAPPDNKIVYCCPSRLYQDIKNNVEFSQEFLKKYSNKLLTPQAQIENLLSKFSKENRFIVTEEERNLLQKIASKYDQERIQRVLWHCCEAVSFKPVLDMLEVEEMVENDLEGSCMTEDEFTPEMYLFYQ